MSPKYKQDGGKGSAATQQLYNPHGCRCGIVQIELITPAPLRKSGRLIARGGAAQAATNERHLLPCFIDCLLCLTLALLFGSMPHPPGSHALRVCVGRSDR